MTNTTARRYAPVDHPGIPVPEGRRSWSVPWPGYEPVDITPPELRSPERAAAEHWVLDTCTDPREIRDELAERRTHAVVPWDLDALGWPLHPGGRTGRCGRNLRAWGENAAADPVVLAGTGARQQLLLIRRGDCGQWAIPGGHVDPGETPVEALQRELAEETGVDVSALAPRIVDQTLVDDPRATDHAWIATTVGVYRLEEPVTPHAGDDAVDARWWPAASLVALTTALTDAREQFYAAHREVLAVALAPADA
ncbi:MAG: NUDIX domain-containing protein [Pseudonocardia sp.]|nr:NUDIX domain-containing protein [Pseudonocardia sp.]